MSEQDFNAGTNASSIPPWDQQDFVSSPLTGSFSTEATSNNSDFTMAGGLSPKSSPASLDVTTALAHDRPSCLRMRQQSSEDEQRTPLDFHDSLGITRTRALNLKTPPDADLHAHRSSLLEAREESRSIMEVALLLELPEHYRHSSPHRCAPPETFPDTLT